MPSFVEISTLVPEKKIFEVFLSNIGMAAIFVMWPGVFINRLSHDQGCYLCCTRGKKSTSLYIVSFFLVYHTLVIIYILIVILQPTMLHIKFC